MFKNELRSIQQTMKSASSYTGADRAAEILFTRMCILCSPLNDLLCSQVHITDSPNCSCTERRGVRTFSVFDYSLYVTARNFLTLFRDTA